MFSLSSTQPEHFKTNLVQSAEKNGILLCALKVEKISRAGEEREIFLPMRFIRGDIMYAQNVVSSHADIITYLAVASDHSQVSFLYLR